MMALSTLAAVIAIAALLLVIVDVVIKAAPAIKWHFLTQNPSTSFLHPGGGGIANSIVGSAILIGLSSLISIPIGILVAIYTSEFASPRSVVVHPLRARHPQRGADDHHRHLHLRDARDRPPSNRAGPGHWRSRSCELPIVARSAQEVLALVPGSLKEAGLALGLRRWRIVTRVVLPTAIGGLITGAVLGVARVAGETAPLLFTTSIFSNIGITTDPSQALPNIPVTIFTLSESPTPSDHAKAWAAALVLILFVLIVSVVARTFNERSRRKLSG